MASDGPPYGDLYLDDDPDSDFDCVPAPTVRVLVARVFIIATMFGLVIGGLIIALIL